MVVDVGHRGGGSQPRPVGVDRAQCGGGQRALDQGGETVAVDPGRGRGGDAPVGQRHLEADRAAGLADVLVDEGVGEAGQRRAAPLGGDLGLGPVADQVEHLLAEVGRRGHHRTPTRTPRKRAGAAECPVWAVCIG